MAVNQVIVGDEVKLDLTGDTVSENNLLAGVTAHNAAGEPIEGAVVVAPIDSELSETSENPVQNKAIFAALSEKASSSHSHSVADITDFPEIPTGDGGEFTIITGTYTGTGSSQVIDLGFEPEAVFVCAATSSVNSVDYMPFFALKNSPASYQDSKYTVLSVVTNGFIPHIFSGNYVQNLNRRGCPYNYIALKGVQI